MAKKPHRNNIIPIRASIDLDEDFHIPLMHFDRQERDQLLVLIDEIGQHHPGTATFLLQKADNLAESDTPFSEIREDIAFGVESLARHIRSA